MKHKDIYTYQFNLENDETLHHRKHLISSVRHSYLSDGIDIKEKTKKIIGPELTEYYSNPTEYRFNNLGFRDTKDIEQANDGCIALGDSFTEGVGLKYPDIWTVKLEDKLKVKVFNLGLSGTGLDAWFRVLSRHIGKFTGQYVFLLSHFFSRYSFPGTDSFFTPPTPRNPEYTPKIGYMYDDNYTRYNYQIKILAIESLCSHYGKKLICVNVHDIVDSPLHVFHTPIFHSFELARDGKHLGRDFQDEVVYQFLDLINN